MTRSRFRPAYAAVLAALALALGACGSDDGEPSAGGAPATVSVDQVDGVGAVLVDRAGAALYVADEESDGKVRCTGPCTSFWIPLEAGAGTPTAGEDVEGKLATLERPDGSRQITYDGRPLYRFSDDSGPGKVTGDGLTDDFAGKSFTWHAVTAEGTSSGDASGRGYGY